MGKFVSSLFSIVQDQFSQQATLIAGIVIGMIVNGLYNRFIGEAKLIKSYDVIIKSKEEHIDSLRKIVYDKAKLVSVDRKDKSFFDKITRYFK